MQTNLTDHFTPQSSLYVWIILLTGIFYTLPVLQLITEHQSTSNSTGNLDLCYYNYLCKVRDGKDHDLDRLMIF